MGYISTGKSMDLVSSSIDPTITFPILSDDVVAGNKSSVNNIFVDGEPGINNTKRSRNIHYEKKQKKKKLKNRQAIPTNQCPSRLHILERLFGFGETVSAD